MGSAKALPRGQGTDSQHGSCQLQHPRTISKNLSPSFSLLSRQAGGDTTTRQAPSNTSEAPSTPQDAPCSPAGQRSAFLRQQNADGLSKTLTQQHSEHLPRRGCRGCRPCRCLPGYAVRTHTLMSALFSSPAAEAAAGPWHELHHTAAPPTHFFLKSFPLQARGFRVFCCCFFKHILINFSTVRTFPAVDYHYSVQGDADNCS